MIRVVRDRLSAVEADAILRPVSTDLEAVTHEGSVLEVLAGDDVVRRFQEAGDLPVGGAAITSGGVGLPSSFLIHVAVHSYDEPATETGVRKGLQNGLRRAVEWELGTVAVSPLGTGAGHLDAEAAARVMMDVLWTHLEGSDYPKEVIVVVSGDYEEEVFTRELSRIVPTP